MAGKENLPTLTGMLGLFFIVSDPAFRAAWRGPRNAPALWQPGCVRHSRAARSMAWPCCLVSVAWFLIATFVIVAPLARQYYGTSGPIYLENRYQFDGGLFGALERQRSHSCASPPGSLTWAGCSARSAGWRCSRPNTCCSGCRCSSQTPSRTSRASTRASSTTRRHWSPFSSSRPSTAPAACSDSSSGRSPFRLTPRRHKHGDRRWSLGAVWLLYSSGSAQIDRGWTPLARSVPVARVYRRIMRRWTGSIRQIPADAAVSATSAVHPHLAHREKIYVSPSWAMRLYVLVDVAGVHRHAGDRREGDGRAPGARRGFGHRRCGRRAHPAAGQRAQVRHEIPADFYTFTTGKGRAAIPRCRLSSAPGSASLGYDVRRRAALAHSPVSGSTSSACPTTRCPRPGDPLHRPRSGRRAWWTTQRCDPCRPCSGVRRLTWQKGETVVVETTPWFLPRAFAPVSDRCQRRADGARPELAPARRARTDRCTRAGDPAPRSLRMDRSGCRASPAATACVDVYEGPLYPIDTAEASFAADDWTCGCASGARRSPSPPAAGCPCSSTGRPLGAASAGLQRLPAPAGCDRQNRRHG